MQLKKRREIYHNDERNDDLGTTKKDRGVKLILDSKVMGLSNNYVEVEKKGKEKKGLTEDLKGEIKELE